MTRVQITLTGEQADEFLKQKRALEEDLGRELSRPVAFSLMLHSDESGRITALATKR